MNIAEPTIRSMLLTALSQIKPTIPTKEPIKPRIMPFADNLSQNKLSIVGTTVIDAMALNTHHNLSKPKLGVCSTSRA